MKVRPKKHLGQHFLKNELICAKISASLSTHQSYSRVLEVGPGTGALTRHLLKRKELELIVVEVDIDSIQYLNEHFPELRGRVINQNFLKMDLGAISSEPFAIIGNFPYNISSQILFKVLDFKDHIPEVVGMFQKEVAERIASPPGSKSYGIISVLLQAFYNIEYLFSVAPNEFIPPPKVQSAVIRLKRNATEKLNCDEPHFKRIVKMAFNQRRKTLRNSLKPLLLENEIDTHSELFSKRPEQLSVQQFIDLTNFISG